MPAYRRLPSGLWQATVRLPTGRRTTRSDPLKSVLRAWAEDAELAIRRGEWADPRDGRATVGQWYERWTQSRVVEVATLKRDASHWRCHLQPAWGDVPLAAVTSWDVEAWAARMRQHGVGESTRRDSIRLLRQLMSEATRHRLIPVDPTAGVKLPPQPKHVDRVLSWEEYDRLRLEVTGRDRVIMDLMAWGGLRWGEVAGLHSTRVDVMRRRLLVVETLRHNGTVKPLPKSSPSQRLVPLTEQLALDVAPFLVRTRLFEGVSYSNWRRRVFVPAVARAGLAPPAPTPHDLRHSYGTWLAEGGVPPHEIAALLGHGSLRMTERYVHPTDARYDRAREVLSRASLVRQERAAR